MDKRQKTIFFTGVGVLAAGLIALALFLVFDLRGRDSGSAESDSLRIENEQLKLQNEQMRLEQEFQQLNSDFMMYEGQLQDDSIVDKYNEARQRIEQLLKQLDQERKNNSINQERIRQLEAEIGTLRGLVRHYLEEIQRLGNENAQLNERVEQLTEANAQISQRADNTARENAQLNETVRQARKLNITGLTLRGYNKKGNVEKKISKVQKLGVSFTVSPNNTAAPGMKTFIVRIVSPEGSVLPGGGSFSFDGATLEASGQRNEEYDNKELNVTVYWGGGTTLSAGTYTVEVFCDGYRLDSRKIEMK